MLFLKQSTASQVRTIGPFIDDTDFKAVENGLTIANTDIKLKKNGATAVNKNSGGGTSDVNGMYQITLDATDTGTVGELNLSVKVAGALIVFAEYTVVEEAVYDLWYLAAATGDVKLQGITHTSAVIPTVTTTTTATNVTTVNGLAANVITAASINAAAFNGKGDWTVGNVTVAGFAANAITAAAINAAAFTAAKFGADFITDASLSPAACNQMADHFWRRLVANVEASANGDTIGTSRGAYVVLAVHNNKVGINGSNLEIFQDDDSTTVITKAITTDATADPITDLDTN